MKRRVAREINVFNLSMLDVLASALGSFLILFVLAMQKQAASEQRASQAERELEKLKEDVRRARKELKVKPTVSPEALARAMCPAGGSKVVLEISDWSAEDGDEVRVTLNETVVVASLELVATDDEGTGQAPYRRELELAPGVNDLVIEALSNGRLRHNSARVKIDPCRDGMPEEFRVDIDATAAKYPKTKTITIASQ